uniref:Uncharacterized protein n=1 Tax=Micrurus carvalhoi TaxID=3147026 RepID=A0A2H6NHF9_9SAUR
MDFKSYRPRITYTETNHHFHSLKQGRKHKKSVETGDKKIVRNEIKKKKKSPSKSATHARKAVKINTRWEEKIAENKSNRGGKRKEKSSAASRPGARRRSVSIFLRRRKKKCSTD